MKIKKTAILLLIVTLLSIYSNVYADYSDVPQNASYGTALKQISDLGIMAGNENGQFKPNMLLTREQFLKALISALGMNDTADKSKGTTKFKDVDPKGYSSGYINAALNKGIIKISADGRFNPMDNITLAQACTMAVRALEIKDQSLERAAPDDYIKKARALGFLDGINLGKNDPLPKWAAALLLDKVWLMNAKNLSYSELDRIFSVSTALTDEYTVLGNSKTDDELAANQIITDKGILYTEGKIALEPGNKYRFVINGDNIIKASNELKTIKKITVANSVDSTITYSSGDKEQKMTLSSKLLYYYHGQALSNDKLKDVLQTGTSIAFAANSDNTGYDYAVIFDPVFSKPEVAKNFSTTVKKLGEIDLHSGQHIYRNTVDNTVTPAVNKLGEGISASDIRNGNVVYQVSNVWGESCYILVVDNKAEGKITSILPNRASAKSIEIDGKEYAFSSSMDTGKISSSSSSFKLGDYIIVILGYDGKVVDIKYSENTDPLNYAFVINYTEKISTAVEDRGTKIYTVKILLDTGAVATYKVNTNPMNFKGKLIAYSKIDIETVSLTEIEYNHPNGVNIKKDGRQIDSDFITDDIRIFNYISNPSSGDCQVKVLKWDDLPYGPVSRYKVLHMNKTGSFDDVNLIVFNDIFDQYYKTAYVKRLYNSTGGSNRPLTYNYTFLVDGKEYPYSTPKGDYLPGTMLKVRFENDAISYIAEDSPAWTVTAKQVQAVDTKRIKINNSVFLFKDNMTIYYRDSAGNVSVKGTGDIDTSRSYGSVSVYLDDRPESGGKVEAIVVNEF